MGWNGSGGFSFTYNWVNDKNNAIPITASRMDTQFNDAVGGFTNCLTRDGQGIATANLPMGGFKHTGAAAGTTSGDYLTYGGNYIESTFTPTDASGASLSFTSPVGYARRIANIVHIWGSLTYPTTADGTTAKIGSLPYTSANLTTQINGFVGTVFFGGGGGLPGGSAPNWLIVNKNAQTMQFAYGGGVTLTNANLSTYSINFYACYPV